MEDLFSSAAPLPSHRLELYLHPTEEVKWADTTAHLLQVFVDDYVLAIQPSSVDELTHLSRAALRAIHSVFLSPDKSGHLDGRDPISLKKLNKGMANGLASK